MSSTNLGLRLDLMSALVDDDSEPNGLFEAILPTQDEAFLYLTILLRSLGPEHQYARVGANTNIQRGPPREPYELRTFYVRQNLSIPQNFFAEEMHGFYVAQDVKRKVSISRVWPALSWNQSRSELVIPEYGDDFTGVFFFKPRGEYYRYFITKLPAGPILQVPDFQVILDAQRILEKGAVPPHCG
ncbi:hypothetical protein K469DRAFT_686353 [Zopfia rhizophila CBS 207.26]|uniref:Uncharacterized protein n=1 Tax=Zopfia rhizophila CBS 207.26 TaxID=1314779 RepID=A0A6A6E7R0_9PEZI|nr:hypothetical protein K469DRAFT_686353 [Zopfia rhizophila CBS 207.26]